MFKSPNLMRFISFVGGAVVAVALSSSVVAAATARAYTSTRPIAIGSLVSIDPAQAGGVIATVPANGSQLLGAVVPAASSTLEFNTPGAQIDVAESGSANVLVSDINGPIKAGDHVTVSPLSGIGMKQTAGGISAGIASTDFKVAGAVTKAIMDKAGKSHQVHIAMVKVDLGVGQYSPPQPQASYIPLGLQSLANAISGRPTAPWRILAGFMLLLVAVIMIGSITYASIRHSLIAIGRNPLSSPAVYRSLFQLIIVTVGIMFVSLFGIYFVLVG